ncbi:MAG: hypothetical protein O4861_20340 [Trichodesmium sp. St16_bin4-tuft]|uniref:Uncharacterized protein n=1 Tax=Trichodesmium erythraeum (strain IMS101) TaxID=203124 RepID=Q11A07_TRIEI|nr:hypothetical protein [Trichodesmium sp. ALOHA_ZT_67]MCL2929416.1 hypothetical protein [Trichodesmium sp. MAG_R01]MDE5079415.1 hypothetical protein [Trichodesmium sp. St2_bin6]MDE5093644.1 hypothetical protein [Trichodesmium sp. St11_bin5]MDE5100552.1 hypothetical protein [Trichodesmium sp. St16_bin4-tuft]
MERLARGSGVSAQVLSLGGMSASPVMDMRGKVLGVYGISRLEIIKSFVLQKGGLLTQNG